MLGENNYRDMKHTVQFIGLEEDDKDLLVSFVANDPEIGVRSLILHRTLFFEEVFGEEERGVKVSLEGDNFDQEDFNMLKAIKITDDEISIKTTFREYQLDIRNIQRSEVSDMLKLLKKQNYDNRFMIHIA